MTLNELEALADAATFPHGIVMSGVDIQQAMTAVNSYNLACHPDTIKQLIALCKLQHEALKSFQGDHWYEENAGEAIAAFESFERGEK